MGRLLRVATATVRREVPPEVVTPAGVTTTPELSDAFGRVWQGSGHGLEIGVLTHPMAKEVETHIAMSYGKSTDHPAWLRIDGHYTSNEFSKPIERRPAGCRWTCPLPPSHTSRCMRSVRPESRPTPTLKPPLPRSAR
jgi:hypothetical protein